MPEGSQEKTEQATPRRLQEARRKGQVPKSADLNGAVLLLAAGLFALLAKDSLLNQTRAYFYSYFNSFVHQQQPDNYLVQILIDFAVSVFAVFIPFFLVLTVVALGVNMAQIGLLVAPEAVKPRLDKLNPLNGLKNMFSGRAMFELVKSILKIIIVGWTVYAAVRGELPNLLAVFHLPPSALLNQVLTVALKVMLWGAVVYLGIALLDLLYQRYAFQKQMRMTKQEVKDEYKQTEGDPQIKGWLRRRQRQLLMNLVRKEVPRATVVVTNPTHYAVALRYEPPMEAPVVVAKGSDRLALQIKEVARQHQVPVVENVEVARFLYASVEPGQAIPVEMYQAVAEILALVYRLKNKKGF
ncbi:flagellar biosynthesis protein FlhB [Desulforamulus hydrothermalis]|uniref:Flagellar biosynthetic protein FlhB n=1 Tax=Desulforamulus hydrothermalis Lam5 = DSM 18033 TaxID=1121428 RepID=K8E0N6_9FIRM|nr:flagellar biosynthesis protein FlhB [Desulforamulus hydrothermalis]CCO09179.1 flagellar export pore protein FlhB [Desulforamulus hydrothermalis Lam5 = DSM 18033]SHH11195.1 flagellar biosynthetic protein FlhB [Desulforamulus hydrothermalis Lam5 = DSM 18033]